MTKSAIAADVLRDRVLRGDYALLGGLPGERRLAIEFGISHMTARRAVQKLLLEGVVDRDQHGRLIPAVGGRLDRPLRLALFAPTFRSPAIELYRHAIERLLPGDAHGALRPIPFRHWDDTVLTEALTAFDGVFLIPSPETPSAAVIERLRAAPRLVVVGHDWSAHGIRSIRAIPPAAMQQLLDHLHGLGHRRIACLNTQSNDATIAARIDQWRWWMAAHGCVGPLIDAPVLPYTGAGVAAHAAMTSALAAGFDATALVCTTLPAALGSLRALHDAGRQVPRDCSIGGIDGEELAALCVPSITAIEPADVAPLIAPCLAWMAGSAPWAGSLLQEPPQISLVIRESTGPASAAHLSLNQS